MASSDYNISGAIFLSTYMLSLLAIFNNIQVTLPNLFTNCNYWAMLIWEIICYWRARVSSLASLWRLRLYFDCKISSAHVMVWLLPQHQNIYTIIKKKSSAHAFTIYSHHFYYHIYFELKWILCYCICLVGKGTVIDFVDILIYQFILQVLPTELPLFVREYQSKSYYIWIWWAPFIHSQIQKLQITTQAVSSCLSYFFKTLL